MVRAPQGHAKGTEREKKTDVTTDNIPVRTEVKAIVA